MNDFYIGDVVKLIETDDENECFVITDLNDFSYKDKQGVTIVEIEYELMKMYPIKDESETIHIKECYLELVAKKKSSKHKLLLQFILAERKKMGIWTIPEYTLALKYSEEYHEQQGSSSKKKLRPSAKEEKDTDVVRYDLLKDIPECFDAINTLTSLYEDFGDEAYLQLREITQKRLVELVSLLDTVDSSLDAMNFLTLLHETFGEDDYLKLRDIVVQKLKQLV